MTGHNFVDEHILEKLRQLDTPPADLCDDGAFFGGLRWT